MSFVAHAIVADTEMKAWNHSVIQLEGAATFVCTGERETIVNTVLMVITWRKSMAQKSVRHAIAMAMNTRWLIQYVTWKVACACVVSKMQPESIVKHVHTVMKEMQSSPKTAL